MRVEYRQLGADMNAYVGMAALARRGPVGHRERGRAAASRCAGNGYRSDAAPLPRNLRTRSPCSTGARCARELLGEEFVDHYVRTREWEVRQYERAVTTWELERYLELV